MADRVSEPNDETAALEERLRIVEAMAEAANQIAAARNVAELEERVRALPPRLFGGGSLDYIAQSANQPVAGSGEELVVVTSNGRPNGWLYLRGHRSTPFDATLLRSLATLLGAALDTLRQFELNRQLQDSLQVDRAYFEQLFAAAPEAIVVLDGEDRVVRANREFERLFGYTLAEAEGVTINELIVPPNHKEDAFGLTRAVARGEQVQEETVRRRKDGTLVNVSILGTPVLVGGDQVAVYGIYRDITEQKRTEDALRRLSTTDELTGLLNRRGFFLLAEQQRRLARRKKADLLLLYIDVNHFKQINDTYGHHEGDQVLVELGELLRSCYRDSDILARVTEEFELLARMGGDEFVVLAVDATENSEEILTARLRDRLNEYNDQRPTRPYRISLSVGSVRVAAEPDVTIDALLAAADRRMYEDKRGPLRL
jgi:diguanylate cyclase (GGDEF)-like protein/PAS domain S-box-containing protein